MTEILNTLTKVSRSFTYDVFGNTISTTKNSDTTDYIFDSFHRRTLKKVNGTLQEKYVYLDQLRLGAVVTTSGQIAQRFVYGTKSHVPDYIIAGTEKYRIISDNIDNSIDAAGVTNFRLGDPNQTVRINENNQLSSYDLLDTYVHEFNHALLNFSFNGRTGEFLDTNILLPGQINRNLKGPGSCPNQ